MIAPGSPSHNHITELVMKQHILAVGGSRLTGLSRLLLVLALCSMFAACATINHRHTRAAVFVGEAELTAGTLKGFVEPRFIYLDGEKEITWTIKGPPGATAFLSGLTFMEESKPGSTDYDSGAVTVTVGKPVKLRLRSNATDPVYEYRITIRINGVDYPVNYPPKVIP